MEQRKAAKEIVRSRVPIVRVLLALGIFLVFSVLTVISIGPKTKLPILVMLALAIGSFLLYIFIAMKYNKAKAREQESTKINVKSAIASILFMILLLVIILFGFSFFIWLSGDYPFKNVDQIQQDALVETQIIALVIYFASSPFIMALWYKTAPGIASKFIVKVFKLFNRKSKTKISEIMVIDTPQDHSFVITLKRACTALIFSLTTKFLIWDTLLRLIDPIIPSGILFKTVYSSSVISIDSEIFIRFCDSIILNTVFPLVLSFVFFFWAMPSSYILDDAGVVYFKKYTKRRQPAEIKTVSAWFFSIVKAILGTSAIFSYYSYITNNAQILNVAFVDIIKKYTPLIGSQPAQNLASVSVAQLGIFLFGFPFIGTILMAFILLLFQESQYNRLKTHLYQELVNIKIDPRIVNISLEREDQVQEKTLTEFTGENFFHNLPLKDSLSKLPAPGDIPTRNTGKNN